MAETFNEELDYSFGQGIDLDNVQDLLVAEDNTEVQVEITEVFPNKENCYIRYVMKITSLEGQYASFSHFMNFPKPEDNSEKTDNKKRAIKRFDKNFKIDRAAGSCDTHVGSSAWVVLKQEQTENYGPQNGIRRFPNKD